MGVGAVLDVISPKIPSVKPQWHPQSTGEQSGLPLQSEPPSFCDCSLRTSSWKREQLKYALAPKPADAHFAKGSSVCSMSTWLLR